MRSERRRIWKCLIFVVLLTLLAFVSVGCAADTHTVCPGGSCDYTSIQDAINAAQTGDTIEVHSGTYYENVNVDRQLILRGKDTGEGKPLVDAGRTGSAIALSHDGIVLDGFTVTNASGYWQAGISLVYSDNSIVINSTANLNNETGIILWFSNNNTLTNNTANSNNYYGIILDHSSNNTLTDNTANSNNWHGFYIHESSTTNTLAGNIANSNNHYGIRLASSSNNTLTNNTASNNKFGIFVGSSNNNTLTNNVANSNIDGGISLVDSSNNNHIYNNYFDNTNNAYDDGTNIWNITQTSGKNIIGGSNLGGNYWSDYTGEDTNGDGIGDIPVPYNASGNIVNGGDWLPLVKAVEPIFDTGEGSYPSISGTFIGTITPSRNLTVSKLYTYSCTGTGGHTKSIELYDGTTPIASGVWNGYQGDWHNITFTEVTLLKDHEYRYVIVTGSYPQIIHAESKDVTGGTITCTEFVDINGKRHEGGIPAIRLDCLAIDHELSVYGSERLKCEDGKPMSGEVEKWITARPR